MSSRAELREHLDRARARFDAAVDGVDVETLKTLPVCGHWTAAAVAGHLADWNIELLAVADHATGGSTPARPPIATFDEFNARNAAAREGQSWADARADLDATIADVYAALDRYSDQQLEHVTAFPWSGEGPISRLFQIAAGHVEEHTEDLERHLKRT